MNLEKLYKHYDKFDCTERAQLYFSSLANEGYPEAKKLVDSCPKFRYQSTDKNFRLIIDKMNTMTFGVAIDYAATLEEIHCLQGMSEANNRYSAGVIDGFNLAVTGSSNESDLTHPRYDAMQKLAEDVPHKWLTRKEYWITPRIKYLATITQAYKQFLSEKGFDPLAILKAHGVDKLIDLNVKSTTGEIDEVVLGQQLAVFTEIWGKQQ